MHEYICFRVAGTRHYRAAELHASKRIVKGLQLRLKPDPLNKFDPNAVAVLAEPGGELLGFVPAGDTGRILASLCAEKLLSAEVNKVIAKNGWLNIDVAVTIAIDNVEARAHLYRPPKPPRTEFMPYGGVFFEPSKYTKLEKMFGPAVHELRDTFLALAPLTLEAIFADYAKAHGESAAAYARRTYPRWQDGHVKLSGLTMERLLDLMPQHLKPEARLKFLQGALSHNRPEPTTLNVRIDIGNPEPGFAEVRRALATLIPRDVLAHLPAHVMDAARWLYENDITAARGLIAEAERKRTMAQIASARREIEVLEDLVARRRALSEARYAVTLPTGALNVAVERFGVYEKIVARWRSGASR